MKMKSIELKEKIANLVEEFYQNNGIQVREMKFTWCYYDYLGRQKLSGIDITYGDSREKFNL
jgi:hypothetical protein